MQAPEPIDIPVKAGIFVQDDFDPERARLHATRCARCGETFFPARRVCPRCHTAQAMEDVALGRIGRIHAVSLVAHPPHHYARAYWLAEIDLPEGVRLVAQLEASPEHPPAVGKAVSMTTRPILMLPDSRRLWAYVFAPHEDTQ